MSENKIEYGKPIIPKNLDGLIDLSKTNLEVLALDLESSHSPLDEYALLYKLKFLITERMEFIKPKAIDNYHNNFGGSTTEEYLKIKMQLRHSDEWEYSEAVDKQEEKIKQLQEVLKAQKQLEKSNGKAKRIGKPKVIIAFTLK